MKTLFLFICFFSLSASASFDSSCLNLENAQAKLKMHIDNIVNSATTRMGHGGFYKKKEWVCKKHICKEKTSDDTRTVYEPGHPDANRRGYVKYPNIDVRSEYAAMTHTASEIRSLADEGACLSKLTELKETLIIKYSKGQILTDIFKFGKHSEIISWARTFINGKRQIYDFSQRIDRQKFATNSFAF